mmetsp:Transcript_30889/g.67783  ORF Transcript_30889/g.67783 Transcript_30889/m.67783 type:complete len:278 (-) Transcript_30889:19-852(-)
MAASCWNPRRLRARNSSTSASTLSALSRRWRLSSSTMSCTCCFTLKIKDAIFFAEGPNLASNTCFRRSANLLAILLRWSSYCQPACAKSLSSLLLKWNSSCCLNCSRIARSRFVSPGGAGSSNLASPNRGCWQSSTSNARRFSRSSSARSTASRSTPAAWPTSSQLVYSPSWKACSRSSFTSSSTALSASGYRAWVAASGSHASAAASRASLACLCSSWMLFTAALLVLGDSVSFSASFSMDTSTALSRLRCSRCALRWRWRKSSLASRVVLVWAIA